MKNRKHYSRYDPTSPSEYGTGEVERERAFLEAASSPAEAYHQCDVEYNNSHNSPDLVKKISQSRTEIHNNGHVVNKTKALQNLYNSKHDLYVV